MQILCWKTFIYIAYYSKKRSGIAKLDAFCQLKNAQSKTAHVTSYNAAETQS